MHLERIQLDNVHKRYSRSGPWVLAGIDLTVAPGTVVRLSGGNGGGKSTLLRLLAGIHQPTKGAVRGRPAVVGYVPERFPPALRFTPAEYLRALGRARGLSGRRAAARVDELLDRFDLTVHADRRLAELSKGTTQKVAVSQALLVESGLLVLDEAWTGLDSAAQTVLADEARRHADAGSVVVFTDHARRAHTLRATTHLAIAGGSLSEVADSQRERSAVRIELRSSTGGGADRWRDVDGARVATADPAADRARRDVSGRTRPPRCRGDPRRRGSPARARRRLVRPPGGASRVIAVAGYHLVDFTRSQRWVAPLTVFAVMLGLVYAMDAGPAPAAFSVTATVLLPVAAWLGWSVTSVRSPARATSPW